MAIEIQPGRYYVGFWYCEVSGKVHPPHGGSVMGCFWRELDRPPIRAGIYEWVGQYRHRYYCEEELGVVRFGGKDRFSWYGFKGTSTEAELEAGLDRVFGTIEALGAKPGFKAEKWFIRGDVYKYVDLVKSGDVPEWMNVRMVEGDPAIVATVNLRDE